MRLRFVFTFVLVAIAVAAARGEEPPVDFGRQIRPILADRCFVCHGPDAETREAGLRLDMRDVATSELDSGLFAVIAGKPEESELVARIDSEDEALRMPPIESGKLLTPEERALLRRWIAEGAKYETHWAFVPPKHHAPPTVTHSTLVRNPIDAFVIAQLEKRGLTPSPEADKQDLVRRLYFDLIGLPPTPAEMDRFLHDTRPDAYERLVDELMFSPHYGERMAIEWLDGARYADSNGYQNDFARTMWPWRDWVINAFNGHMPYNQFLTEQLAGDLLPNATRSQRVATGFNRNNRTVTEAGSIEEEWHVENVIDRADTTGMVFLGLTMGCARCHDHKFDPISQQEFYEFYSFFNNVNEKGVYTEQRGNVAPLIQVMSEEQESQFARLKSEREACEKKLAAEMERVRPLREQWLDRVRGAGAHDEPPAVLVVPLKNNWTAQIVASGNPVEAVVAEKEPRPESVAEFFGKAASFKGAERLTYPTGFHLERTQPYSVSFWIKPTADVMGAIVSQLSTAKSFRGADVFLLEDHRVAVHLVHRWPDNALKVSSLERLPANGWTHVVVTYDGSSKASGVNIFVNGRKQATNVDVDNLTGDIAVEEPFRIGSRSSDGFLVGTVGDVRVFVRKLSAEESSSVTQASVARLAQGVQLDSLAAEHQAAFDNWMVSFSPDDELATVQRARDELAQKTKELEAFEKEIPTTMVMEELPQPREAYVLSRGQYDAPDKQRPVSADVPDFLPPLPADAPRNRLGLAQWMTQPNHPLTVRVAVNREWQRFFGQGLVKTPDNFGLQSEPPSHRELLDYLATEFVRNGWNLQQLQKLIVTSATYRQSSRVPKQQYEADPDNRDLARGPRARLKAELIRDNALAISGLLNAKIGGRSVMPYQPAGLWEELAGGAFEVYTQDHGDDLHRRSLYTYRKRTVPHPTLATFDAPGWEICQIKRSNTNTPLQSLALLNDVTYVEAARAFAERMLREGGDNAASRITFGFRAATGRRPTEEERARLEESLSQYQTLFAAKPEEAKQFVSHGEAPRTGGSQDDVELAAHTAIATVLLNLDETITKN